MNVIKWRDSYATGVEQFDREHHKIVELINAMFIAIRDQKSREEVEQLLDEVLSYTQYHFDNEEKAMRDTDYPDLEAHVAEHTKLKEDAAGFKALLEENFSSESKHFYRFLRDWLTEHILDCDKAYSGHLLKAHNE